MKKIENFDHLRLEKTLTTSEEKDHLEPTTEEHQALKAIFREVMIEELEKREKQTSQKFEQLEQSGQHLQKMILSYLDESKQREQLMLKGQEKSESMLKKLGENPAFLAGCGVILGDWANDLVKEVVKKMVGEERFEGCGDAIKAFLQSFSSPVWDLISQLSPELIIATAVVTLLAAKFFLNHTATVWSAIRSGLAKLKSMFASKK